jgi:hypothetical protein
VHRMGRGLRHLVNAVHNLIALSKVFKVLAGDGATIATTNRTGKLVRELVDVRSASTRHGLGR